MDANILEPEMLSSFIPYDDCDIIEEPQEHVDYLSYNWKESELIISWKNISSTKNCFITNLERLENASWRTWMKSKYTLKTVTPESVNWLKESDATWLYGPLYKSSNNMLQDDLDEKFPKHRKSFNEPLRRSNSTPTSPVKPILKKRSISETMAMKSSLLHNIFSGSSSSLCNLNESESQLSYLSRSSSFTTNSSAGSYYSNCSNNISKRIRFNEIVDRCIAIGDEFIEEYNQTISTNDGKIKFKDCEYEPDNIQTIVVIPSSTLKEEHTYFDCGDLMGYEEGNEYGEDSNTFLEIKVEQIRSNFNHECTYQHDNIPSYMRDDNNSTNVDSGDHKKGKKHSSKRRSRHKHKHRSSHHQGVNSPLSSDSFLSPDISPSLV